MGLVRANFVLTNYNRDKRACVDALVDTGATEVIVTAEIAVQLGFDLEEVSRLNVTLADGRTVSVPRLRGVEVHFENRSFLTEAIVLGDECMMGAIPLEGMDLVVDPKRERLIPNPKHPDGPCFRV